MTTIIVGFDATEQARDALHLAAALSDRLDGQLIVASAIEFGPIQEVQAGPYSYPRGRAEHFERVFAQARAELGGTDFEPRELQDTAAHGLTELAEREQADLLVIGSTHHGPIGRVLAGSVAAGLIHGAPCAVLVAPRGWSRDAQQGFGRIGVAYDGSDEAKLAVDTARRLARDFGAGLRLITIAPYIGAHGEFERIEASRPAWAEVLKGGAELAGDGAEIERVLRQGREATELALQSADLDLLVLGSRAYGPLRRTLVGSVSTELVRTALCPVLIVPRGSRPPGGPGAPTAEPG